MYSLGLDLSTSRKLKAMMALPTSAILFHTLHGSTLYSTTGAQQCWPTHSIAMSIETAPDYSYRFHRFCIPPLVKVLSIGAFSETIPTFMIYAISQENCIPQTLSAIRYNIKIVSYIPGSMDYVCVAAVIAS